ncbi:MAG TPA: hypothetical protein VGI92_13185 [Gemmatimonadales bacterium]|jgi:TolB-like protein/tetratricopeptide (TPR) repeat protein
MRWIARSFLLLAAGASTAAARLAAQCPDGTPPPCRIASAPRTMAPPPLSIAVLPFESRSPDTADIYLADGVTEEVANKLTQVGKLQVKARGLVAAQVRRTPDPTDAARRLGVAWFVHGNVRHVSGQLLVNVELVRAATGEEAWASRFPRRDTDVFAVQAEVAESVAVIVGGRLTPGERAVITHRPTRNNEAYRLFLYGNTLMTRRTQNDVAQAVEAYTHAVTLDPRFAAAWARIGLARGVQRSWDWNTGLTNDSLLAIARSSALRALALDSTQAEAWLANGFVEQLSRNLGAAHDSYDRAARLDSLNAEVFHFYGTLYALDCPGGTCLTNVQAGSLQFRRALALDPGLRNTWRHLALLIETAGRFSEAEALFDTSLSFGPWPQSFHDRATIRLLRRDVVGARRDMEANLAAGGDPDTGQVAWAQAMEGDSSMAMAAARRLAELASPREIDLIGLADLDMILGRKDDAIAALERIRALPEPVVARCGPANCSTALHLWQVVSEGIFLPLRGQPRFDRLVEDVRPHIPWLDARSQ